MAKARGEKTNAAVAEAAAAPAAAPELSSGQSAANFTRLMWLNRGLLLGALLAALAVYGATLNAGWFYDDQDYVLLDPRVNNLSLFMPGSWSKPPPPLQNPSGQTLILPGYDKPVIDDRYLWHLSFALERVMFGADYGPAAAHAINIGIHLACVLMLYIALSRLVRLYMEEGERKTPGSISPVWRLLPGIAALIFAIHPWAAEQVCYVSARNGAMGAFFSLLGLWLFAGGLQTERRTVVRVLLVAAAMFCALLAYGCKENFVAAPAGYMLAVWPLIWRRYWTVSPARTMAILGGGLGALVLVAWLGIQSSERARGLFAQASNAGWQYFFEIQSPTLLRTLTDHILCRRLSIESGFPGWDAWACWAAVLINILLILAGTLGGRIAPLLMGLGWYYIFLLPSNSILPRPDFLAGRNVYLPTAGIAVLLAGVIVWGLSKARRSRLAGTQVVAGFAASVLLYWGLSAHAWAEAFVEPEQVWQRSADVAPDHAVLRINLALQLLKEMPAKDMGPKEKKRIEQELKAALAAEDTPTMRYHAPRPKQMVRSLAYRMLGDFRYGEERYDEADEFYTQSWAQSHTLEVWLNWLQTALNGKMSARQTAILEEGFREWPDEWWPKVARDTTQAINWRQSKMTPQMQQDFEAAERAPTAQEAGLRLLQIQVILMLAQQSIADRPLALSRLERLRQMGASAEQLQALEKALGKEPEE